MPSDPAAPEFWIRLWGVRGSTPCPGSPYVRYGGNTPCVEVMCGTHRLIFDAGSGIRQLGGALMANGAHSVQIFLTHTHVDHVNGFPFFRPAYSAARSIELWAGHLTAQGLALRDVLCKLMQPTLFPIGLEAMQAKISYNDFQAGDVLEPGHGIRLRTTPLNHPGRATGYRIEYGGKVICYVTDVEHEPGKPDAAVLDLIAGADIVVYDSHFTDEEFPKYRGWGHSTWEEGVRLCEQAGARRLILFHHSPERDDDALDRIADQLDRRRPGSRVGREGHVLHP